MNDSTLYTIGAALSRALDHHVDVEILVGGEWVRGAVVSVDSYRVVLGTAPDQHSVVRTESIAAVKIGSGPPARVRPRYHPIPSPRAATT